MPLQFHKSQGQTLNKAVIDLGKREMAAGCTFVAISRLHSLEDGVFEPMSYQRFVSIYRGKNFQSTGAEEGRLEQLALATQSNVLHLMIIMPHTLQIIKYIATALTPVMIEPPLSCY